MAIYRCSMQVFSRAKGQTSTAAAAYRAAIRVEDQRTGVVHDYRRRRGVESVEMLVPDAAPDWARDPSSFWNAAEAIERKNGRPAREWLVALPHELSPKQRQDLVRALAGELVGRYGVGVMAAVHEPNAQGDDRNFHVHLLFSTRRVDSGGLAKKVRELDDRVTGPEEVERLRERTAQIINRHLDGAGIAERVDHRRLAVQAREAEEQGDYTKAFVLTKAAQKTEGRAATAAKRRGARSWLGEWNARVQKDNEEVLQHYVARVEHAAHYRLGYTQRRVVSSPRPRLARRPSLPSSIIAAMERSPGAFGEGDHVINQQAKLLREHRRANEAAERRFIRMLEEEMARIARKNRVIFALYATALRLDRWDVRALAQHCARDAACVPLLRESVKLRLRMAEAEAAAEQRRDEYGVAMVRTTQARTALEAVETSKPSALRPLRRREWAELRRRQRDNFAKALATEHAARAAASPKARVKAFRENDRLNTELARLEQARRRRFPLPVDAQGRPDQCQMPRKPPQKIGNKITDAPSGYHPNAEPRLTMTLELRPRRRRGPI